jgi:hypothetical protein
MVQTCLFLIQEGELTEEMLQTLTDVADVMTPEMRLSLLI